MNVDEDNLSMGLVDENILNNIQATEQLVDIETILTLNCDNIAPKNFLAQYIAKISNA